MEQNFSIEATEDSNTFLLKPNKNGQGEVKLLVPENVLYNNNITDDNLAIYEDLVNKTASI